MQRKIIAKIMTGMIGLSLFTGCNSLSVEKQGSGKSDATSIQSKTNTDGSTVANESNPGDETNGNGSTTPTSTTVPVPKIKGVNDKSTIADKDPAEVKQGNVYDTATVRDWIDDGEGAPNYPKDQKIVFLTFDDGPSTNITPKDLDILKENKIPATFFYLADESLPSKADLVKRTKEEGHTIAIHTASHDYDYLYPKRVPNVDHVVTDALKAVEQVKAIIPDYVAGTYRFPGGSFSWTGGKTARKNMKATKEALAEKGLEYIDWNALSGDADLNNRDKSAEGLVKYTKKTTKSADNNVVVLLMHDAGHIKNGPKALQGIIDYYKNEGYEFARFK